MMKYSLLFIALLALPTWAAAQVNPVQNVTWELTDTKMTIRFDLMDTDGVERTYDMLVRIKMPENIITPTAGITGHIGQRTGTGRQITWYYTTGGYTQRDLSQDIGVELEATNPNPPYASMATPTPEVPTPNPVPPAAKPPSYLPGTLLAIAGLGVGTFGVIQNIDAFDTYRTYERFECQENETFSIACWDETLEDANDKRVSAQVLMGVGGALLATGAVLILQTRKKRQNQSLSVVPTWDYRLDTGNEFGMAMKWRF